MCSPEDPQHVAAIILAAGASRRFGRLKQLATINHETLLEHCIRLAYRGGCRPIVVVLGCCAEQIQDGVVLDGCVVVRNEHWYRGIGTSIAAGVRVLEGVIGALVLTCDMPLVTSEHIFLLCEAGVLSGSEYEKQIGVPAYFPLQWFASLLALKGDTGAKHLLSSARLIPLANGHLDVDTTADLARVRAQLRRIDQSERSDSSHQKLERCSGGDSWTTESFAPEQ